MEGEIEAVLETYPLLGIQRLKVAAGKSTEEVKGHLRKDPHLEYVMDDLMIYPLGHPPKPNDKFWVTHFVGPNQPPMLWGMKKN